LVTRQPLAGWQIFTPVRAKVGTGRCSSWCSLRTRYRPWRSCQRLCGPVLRTRRSAGAARVAQGLSSSHCRVADIAVECSTRPTIVHVPLVHKWEQQLGAVRTRVARGLARGVERAAETGRNRCRCSRLRTKCSRVVCHADRHIGAQKPPTHERLQQSVAYWHGKPGSSTARLTSRRCPC